jgi:pimeloyl-ACP methyl ester carboxylesterase
MTTGPCKASGAVTAALVAAAAMTTGSAALAGGEAGGPITLRDQGYFYVGARPHKLENGQTAIYGAMYVGFELQAEPQHPYPLLLVHGGGGQMTDYMGTPDGRDGWLDYFIAAGFDVYMAERPGFGRSPNSTLYGDLQGPATVEQFADVFTRRSDQYPGTGEDPNDPIMLARLATSNPGPTTPNDIIKENFAEILDRIGPAIIVTHSAGGPSGWLALDARPDLVKGILAIETAGDLTGGLAPLLTWEPALGEGEEIALEEQEPEAAGLEPCQLQPEDSLRILPAFKDAKILAVVSPKSSFTSGFHCTARTLEQVGADVTFVRLAEDWGIEGNGHFMNDELNNGEIAGKFIEWLSSID